MKFIVSSSSLLKHLQQISGVINSNTVLPILEDFLFEIENKKLNMIFENTKNITKKNDTSRGINKAKITSSQIFSSDKFDNENRNINSKLIIISNIKYA